MKIDRQRQVSNKNIPGFWLVHLVGACLLLASCTSTPPRYYATGILAGLTQKEGLTIFAEPIPPAKPAKRLIDLGEDAQAALIEKSSGDASKLAADFARFITRKESTSKPEHDRSRVTAKRRIRFTLFTEQYEPHERLTEARIAFTPPQGWQFTGWTAPKVERSTVQVAKIVDDIDRNFTLGSVPLFPGFTPGAVAGLDVDKNREITRDLAVEVVELLPSITKKEANIRLYAPFPQSNVAGAYSVDFSLASSKEYVTYNHTFKPNAGKPIMNVSLVSFNKDYGSHDSTCNHTVSHKLFTLGATKAVKRTVDKKKNKRTVDESDDDATYEVIDVHNNKDFEFLDKDLSLAMWSVGYLGASGTVTPVEVDVRLQNGNTVQFSKQCALFTDGQSAREFSTWYSNLGILPGNRYTYKSADNKYEFDVKRPSATAGASLQVSLFPIASITARPRPVNATPQRYYPSNLPTCYVDIP